MKILFLSDYFPPEAKGGAEIMAWLQAEELKHRGHEVKVVTKREVNSLEKILLEFKPEVVHAHNVHQMGWEVLPLAKKHSPKLIVTLHDALAVHYGKIYPKRRPDGTFDCRVPLWFQLRHFPKQFRPFYRQRVRRALKSADRIFAVSAALADGLKQNSLPRVEVMHNGIDVENFRATDEAVANFKKRFSLESKKILLFTGRIGGAKGSDIAIDLVRRLGPEVRLLMVGKTDEARKDDKVIYTGWLEREEIKAAYGAADVVLSLSIYLDPFMIVNLEAMAASKPVLGTIYGGTPEIVVDGETGYLVDPLDAISLEKKTQELLNNPELGRKMGAAGRKRAIENFDLKKVVDRLERVYKGAN